MWITCCISFSLVWSEILQFFCCWLSLSKLVLLTQTFNRYFYSLLSAYLSHMMKNWTNGRTYRALLPFILESEDVQILVVEGGENSGWDFVTWSWFNGIGSLFKLKMNLSANSYNNRYLLYKAFIFTCCCISVMKCYFLYSHCLTSAMLSSVVGGYEQTYTLWW